VTDRAHDALTFRPLSPETFDDFAAMHGRPECQGCFCMYWQFPGDHRAWQLAQAEENRASKRALVLEGKTHGLLAYAGGEVVGTVQFEPRDPLTRLTARMPYKGLAPSATTWALLCFRVRDDQRRRGVARALLDATTAHLRDAHGATAVEAYPRRGEDLHDTELWTGPEALFVAAGFALVRDQAQYPVYRKALP
jgi:GNAT superfamily N-acetyltransferase